MKTESVIGAVGGHGISFGQLAHDPIIRIAAG
jgi:hypothetical protein